MRKTHILAALVVVGVVVLGLLLVPWGPRPAPHVEPSVVSAPAGLRATAGDGQIVLHWSPVPGATSYNVYWSESEGVSKGTGTAAKGIASPPFTHSGLTNGVTVHYVVTAVGEPGESADSTAVHGVPAPGLNASVATTFGEGTKFLYAGDKPLQVGLDPKVIEPRRAAVLRGKVLRRDGKPLAGVKVSVLHHPELGHTVTRADGMFDMAVNGGSVVTMNYVGDAQLPAQRKVRVPWRDYVWLPDVVLIPGDQKVTVIELKSGAPMQLARASVVSDADGKRQASLFVPRGTTAEMVLPDGTTRELEKLSVRATEYTVGPNGPAAMPAELPPNTAYTYAVELTVDEARAAGATTVRFSRPVIQYLENFLDFHVGANVPVGYYDREKAAWIPSENGRVVQVLAVRNGLADLDIDGSGKAADDGALKRLGVDEAERRRLASLYQPGQSLWRVPLTHFSPNDFNAPAEPKDPNAGPPEEDPHDNHETEGPSTAEGCIIEIQNQELGEAVSVTGTPFRLHYRSDRVRGRRAAFSLDIPLSGKELRESVKRIRLEISIAGQHHTKQFPPQPNQRHTFTWDGTDAYGRPVQGTVPATVRIGYDYEAVYRATSRFGANSSGVAIAERPARQDITLWREWKGRLGGWDARAQGLGGWTLSVHHAYDPSGRVLYPGDGRRHRGSRSVNQVATIAAGTGKGGFSGDNGPAGKARVNNPGDITVGPDGSLYIADTYNNRIRRIGPNGTITTVAGGPSRGYAGDGGPATQARLHEPRAVAVGADGSLYIADTGNNRIRRVGPDGAITTVSGTGKDGFSGDGGQAEQAELDWPHDLALGPDGTLYIADTYNHRIRRVGPDGTIATVAGTGRRGFSGDDGLATRADLNYPTGVLLAPDGSLYVADRNNLRVRRIGPDGIITTVAGRGDKRGFAGDGGPATQAQLDFVGRWTSYRGPRPKVGLALGPDGSLYVADTYNYRIRRIGPGGTITTVAGPGPEKGPVLSRVHVLQARLGGPAGLAFGPDGSLYIADFWGNRVWRVSSSMPEVRAAELVIPDEVGRQLYHFDAQGRHLRTLNALTGAVTYRFLYDDAGRLSAVEDGFGNTTRIERNADGAPTAIVAPYGQRTALATDANGYLARLVNPAGEAATFTYADDGLVATLTDPGGKAYRNAYDPLGRLVRSEDPAGGATVLRRTRTEEGFQVTRTTALGREFAYRIDKLPTGGERRVDTLTGGVETRIVDDPNGTRTATRRDQTTVRWEQQPDPRFGMLAPLLKQADVKTPSGLSGTLSATRSATLRDPDNPFTLATLTDTVQINGRTYTRTFDAAKKQVTYSTPEGRKVTRTLDDHGRVLEARAAGLEPITLGRDDRGRLTRLAQGDLAWTFAYDAKGRLRAFANAGAKPWRYEHDDAGRLTQTALPSGRTLKYGYDAAGRLARITMPSGAVHKLTYTAVGLPASYTPPSQQGYTAAYNKDRQLVRLTHPSGRTIADAYGADARLEQEASPEATVTFTRDKETGRLTAVTRTPADGSAAQTVGLGYDGHLLTQLTYRGPATGRYRYRRDKNFFVVGMTLDDRPETKLGRDKDGLLTSVGPFTIAREGPGGAPSRITDGALTVSIGYDRLGRVATRTHAVGGRQFYQIQLSYDPLGRIAEKREAVQGSHHTYSYAYDPDGQLTEVRRDGRVVERYAYDDNGNRKSRQVGSAAVEDARYDAQDRLQQQGAVAYRSDADGFTIQRGRATFTYSARGELLKVVLPDGKAIGYVYDGGGRRVARTGPSGTHQYLYGNPYDPFQVAAVRDPSGTLSVLYSNPLGLLFAIQRGSARYYVATDQVGTPRVICDSTGQPVKILDYDSFGRRTADSNPAFGLPVGFAGGLEDPGARLIRFGYRDYDPEAGRWTARDPILYAGGQANLYAYVDNAPVQFRDPNGLGGGSAHDGHEDGPGHGRDPHGGWTESGAREHAAAHYAVEAGVTVVAEPLTPLTAPLTIGPTAIEGIRNVKKSGGMAGGTTESGKEVRSGAPPGRRPEGKWTWNGHGWDYSWE